MKHEEQVTDCLRFIKKKKKHEFAGIVPPDIRWDVATKKDRWKTSHDDHRHSLCCYTEIAKNWLKFGHSFLRITKELESRRKTATCQSCGNRSFSVGNHLNYSLWTRLNRIRNGAARAKYLNRVWQISVNVAKLVTFIQLQINWSIWSIETL